MSSDALHDALRDLGWSLLTELGAPGVVRHHAHVALDPEPILVTAPALFKLDPRLRDQTYAWCATHAGRISVSRLQGLSRTLSHPAQTEFHRLASTLRTAAKVPWPHGGEAPWERAPEVVQRDLPMERRALFRFRVRALCGVGARADVLSDLIVRAETWTRASDLQDLGYSKRVIASILSDLAHSGIAKQRAEGNALTFQIARPAHFRELLDADRLAFPPWHQVMALVRHIIPLADLASANAAIRRVEANKCQTTLRDLADRLFLDAPPQTRGRADAWEALMSWSTAVAIALAQGTSAALGVCEVRATLGSAPGVDWRRDETS